MAIPETLSRVHVAAAVRDLDAGVASPFGEARTYRLHFGLRQYSSKAVVGRAIAHVTGAPAGPSDLSGGRGTGQAGGVLSKLGFHVEGIAAGPAADPDRVRDILRVFTRIPIPRGQLRLYRLWLDHHPDATPSAVLSQTLSDGDPTVYPGLRAALAKRINNTNLSGPDGPRPGLGLLIGPGGESGERPRPAFWRALEALPELFDHLHAHDEPWLAAHGTDLHPAVPPLVQDFLHHASQAPPAESFEARRDRFFRWLPGRTLTGGRAELHVRAVDDHWVDFDPSATTGRIVLPVELVEEWLRAAHDGRLEPGQKKRQMREIVKATPSRWAAFHHGFETRLSALVDAWWALPDPSPVATHRPTDLPTAHATFRDALSDAGLRFGADDRHDAFTRAFLASVLTKRFVILTGLSGSGKSQIAMRFGEWLGEDRSRVVAVRPDWTSPEALFGFPDLLRRDPETGRTPWHAPPTLQFILQAAESDELHLLVLDEMNLAHVERYFADLLSGMESGKGCVPDVVWDGDDWVLRSGARRPLPANLVFVGTVNVDETTYMFSPKVLDRANTLEFRVRTEDLPDDITDLALPSELCPGPPDALAMLCAVATDRRWHLSRPTDAFAPLGGQLKALHLLLAKAGFEYGHRVYFEALRFAVIHHALGGTGIDHVLDLQVMQKLLPRLHGSRRRVGSVLEDLAAYCFYGSAGPHTDFRALEPPVGVAPRLPISFDKLQRMLAKLDANQFVSFAE